MSSLNINFTKIEKNVQIRKIYDNFHSSVQILVKIIIIFSDFSLFPVFVIFIMKLDINFSSLPEIGNFFDFIQFFGFIH